MTTRFFLAICVALVSAATHAGGIAPGTYVLKTSTLKYFAHHPVHSFDATSANSAKGKLVCTESKCELLVAAPVKSFDSDNSNRDAHMIEITKGAEFPLVSFRATFEAKKPIDQVSGEAEFAGHKHALKITKVSIGGTDSAPTVQAETTFNLKDFAIEAPSLLGVEMAQDIRVTIEGQFAK